MNESTTEYDKELLDILTEEFTINELIKDRTFTITSKILKSLDLTRIFQALEHKELYNGLFDQVDCVSISAACSHNYTENELIFLDIKTGIDIKECDSREKILIKTLYEQIQEKNIDNITTEDLISFVNNARNEAKSSDDMPMQYIHALRVLVNFNFKLFDEKYSILVDKFKELYAMQTVHSEIYHLAQEPDLHFYMVKVTGKNADMWYKYVKNEGSILPMNRQAGIKGFIPSLHYHDQDLTETYVAFVSNSTCSDYNIIDKESIEMFVTMMTSENAHFTSHIGISRSESYQGQFHKNLAVQLHSFIAKATLMLHGNKEYMITVPAANMREILIKSFADNDKNSKIFIGDNYTKYSEESLESLMNTHEAMVAAKYNENSRMRFEYEQNIISIQLLKQKELLDKKETEMPIIVEKTAGRDSKLFILSAQNGAILNNLTATDITGEYAWFFKNPYLIRGSFGPDPLVTCELDTLSNLYQANSPIEYQEKMEMIGDVNVFCD